MSVGRGEGRREISFYRTSKQQHFRERRREVRKGGKEERWGGRERDDESGQLCIIFAPGL